MSSEDVAIKVQGLSKCFEIYETPRDRLKQFLLPRLRRFFGRSPRKYYREFWALKDVSFEVKKGETVGIVGRNGSGKSTLLQLICGTLSPTGGSIQTSGRIAALLELGSGFNPEFTGRENVYMNGALLGLSKEDVDARFDEIVKFADIGDFVDQPVKTYSSGMVVRLAFAVAINVDPQILVVDEALSVGDELFQRKCFSRIEEIKSKGATILFVSHSGAQVVELCDRAILVDTGELIASGVPKRIVADYQRLLYAPQNHRDEVRFSIMDSKTADLKMPAQHSEKFSGADENLDEAAPGLCEETYDPSLSSSSEIEFESHGPILGMPRIFTNEGRRVNGLIRGRRYRCRYQVKFHKDANLVRFGFSIRTKSGFSLSGALTAQNYKSAVQFVEKGKVLDVEFAFNCNFNPGLYFLNIGVFGKIEDDEQVLHRRVDALAFRVLPESQDIETEIVYLAALGYVNLGE